jgi:cytoskeletal protein CcmA (bactofilin family)
MIGSTVVIDGNITSAEDLIIEGKVSGTITATGHEVTVGQAGQLNANISAKIVRIEGKVEGDISGGEKVIISKTGNVLGNIDAPRVTLEDGAKFKGSIEMDPDEQPSIKAVPSGKSDLFPANAAADKSNAS